jgi:hypothetical protein
MSAPGEEVSCHAGVIRGTEGTIRERNRSRLPRLEDRNSCVRMQLMNHIPQSMQEVPGDEAVRHPYSYQCNDGKTEDCSRFNPPGLLTSEILGERKIKAGNQGQVHRVEDLFELRGQQGLGNIGARISQSVIHLLLEQTNIVAGTRFAFFFLQAICMIAMGILVAISGVG